METFLIIIGLIVILRYVSKGLVKLGESLEKLADSWDDRTAANFRTPVPKKKEYEREDLLSKESYIKGDLTDEEFNKKIKMK